MRLERDALGIALAVQALRVRVGESKMIEFIGRWWDIGVILVLIAIAWKIR
jgi:hypothetical protein